VELREILPPDTGQAYLAMRALRTHLEDEAEFVRRVDDVQRGEGYRLAAVFDKEPHALAVAGFREVNYLAWGHALYVDDLSTLPEHRRRGYGRALLVWLSGEAARLGCEQVHLDSGVGPDRADAHRLYMASGFTITAHHFAHRLG